VLTVVEITAAETHAIRRRVLRDGTASDVVEFDGDHLESTFHLAARNDDDVVVGVSTWMLRSYPDRPGEVAFQLRGMASVPEARGDGVGSAMLRAGLERCRSAGASVVWARARDTAIEFYLRHGFATAGLGYVDLATQLPHHDIVLVLDC